MSGGCSTRTETPQFKPIRQPARGIYCINKIRRLWWAKVCRRLLGGFCLIDGASIYEVCKWDCLPYMQTSLKRRSPNGSRRRLCLRYLWRLMKEIGAGKFKWNGQGPPTDLHTHNEILLNRQRCRRAIIITRTQPHAHRPKMYVWRRESSIYTMTMWLGTEGMCWVVGRVDRLDDEQWKPDK